LALKGEMFREIMKNRPAAVVVADSPDFNLRLIKSLRRGGYDGRVYYISPPSVWAWRSYRTRDLAAYVDECLPLFKFEHDYLIQKKCNSLWMGHPFMDEFGDWGGNRDKILSEITGGGSAPIDRDKIVAMLPGSRLGEFEQLWDALFEVYGELENRGYCPVFSVAPGLSERARDNLMSRLNSSGLRRYDGRGVDLMSVSHLVVGSCGTSTAQALLLGKYMVALYKMRPLTGWIGRFLLHNAYFSIPNLLANELICPELIQWAVTPENAKKFALEWLDAPSSWRAERLGRIDELKGLMGRPGVYDFWAGRIMGAQS
jgi:lipid-A-disaccharide synthase